MHRSLAVSLFLLIGGVAHAEALTGKIEDPSMRRKAQLVYVEKIDGTFKAPAEPVAVSQHGNVYLPHITAVVAGTKIVFKSEDPELHNVYARGEKRVLFNDAVLPKMQSVAKEFADIGFVHLTCNIHKEMSAWVAVLQNPFFAVPQKDGTFTINGLKPGTYNVKVWGEELSDEQKAKTMKITVGSAS